MKMTLPKISLMFCLIAGPVSASSLFVTGSDSESNRQTSVSYTLMTVGNNSISTNQSGFTPSNGVANLTTATGVTYSSYLSSLPAGSTLTGATLNFSGLFSNLSTTSSLSGGTFFYQSAFSSVLGTYTVTITSTLANATVSGSSATNYDLWPAFSADILAGNSINVAWSVVDTFSADNSTYANTKKNGSETFQVTGHGDFQALTANNSLALEYSSSVTASAPEPGTVCLAGLALVGLGLVRRRRSLVK
jgi:hypothetical protein